jgi:cell division protein FtsN
MLQDQLPATAEQSAQTEGKPTAKPRFDFHHILPEMEVVVSDEELSAPAAPPPKPPPERQKQSPQPPKPEPQQATKTEKQKAKPAADGSSYLVQVASFRQASDAERLKAKLALLGVQANVQQVTVNGKAYHRVRTGPYQGKQEVNKTRSLLSSNGLDSIAIKLK